MIPKRLRKIKNSSGIANCTICNVKTFLVEHHINGKKIPNYDEDWNRTSICDNCHRLIHEGQIIIEGWFTTTNGRKLLWHQKGEKGITDNVSSPHIINRNLK